MRVSQRLDYAFQALIRLAGQPQGSLTAAGQLADQLRLPRRFVEQQVSALARAGIVRSSRGASGGYALAADPATVTALDVVLALQGDVIDVPQQHDSAAAALWQSMASAAEEHLATTTLADLLEAQRRLDASSGPEYYI